MTQAIIVIPCFNEERRLDAPAFLRFAQRFREFRLLFVDDGSTDGTLAMLRSLHAQQPQRCLVHGLGVNRGKAEAVRQGVLLALEQRPAYVGFWDADLATPLEAIPQLSDVLNRRPSVHAVIGSRLPLSGRRVRRKPLRSFLGRWFSRAASIVIGASIGDTQCGAKLFRASPRLAEVFRTPFLSRWIFDVEILARMADGAGFGAVAEAVYEYPLDEWDEVGGSKVRAKDFVRAAGDLGRIFMARQAIGRRAAVDDAAEQWPRLFEPAAEERPQHNETSERAAA